VVVFLETHPFQDGNGERVSGSSRNMIKEHLRGWSNRAI